MAGKMDDQSKSPRRATALAALLVTAAVFIMLAELLSSEILLYRYRLGSVVKDGSYISSLVFLRKTAIKLGWLPKPLRFEVTSSPSPFLQKDPIFGWSPIPGTYTHIYRRKRENDRVESLHLKVTINSDQSRWTGLPVRPQNPTIYILGDSLVFGKGVSDEQTFAYHLQMAHPEYNVRLFAVSGYGLVQSYLRIQQLKPEITDRDILLVGYADYHDLRHVVAPSQLRGLERETKLRHVQFEKVIAKNPKASISSDGKLSINLVPQDCRVVRSYCNSDDPPLAYMRAVSLRLIREIAEATKAKTYLLYTDGNKNNPVLKKSPMEVISLLPEDFDYFIRDDIVGFDPHPGPYWHYAITQKLLSRIDWP